jgi:hypothetical protein
MQKKIKSKNKQGELIRPIEYARLRRLNPSTVSRQIRSGAIPVQDGLIDADAADVGRLQNLDLSKRHNKKKSAQSDAWQRALLNYGLAEGMALLIRKLQDTERFSYLQKLAVEAADITPEQALKTARIIIFALGIWVQGVIAQNINQGRAKQFKAEIINWVQSTKSTGGQ